MSTREITNRENVISSRDILNRLDYLEIDPESNTDDENIELVSLRKLADECEDVEDWDCGDSYLIRYDHFEDYVIEQVKETGDLDKILDYIRDHIAWDEVAIDWASDYLCVEFDGIEYYVR